MIDLRGVIVPIVDMRMKFALSDTKYDATTVVIILNVARRVSGIVVDAVSDVVTFAAEQIRPVPEFSAQLDTQFIMGLARLKDQLVILLDIEHLLSSPEMQLTDAATAAMSARPARHPSFACEGNESSWHFLTGTNRNAVRSRTTHWRSSSARWTR